MLDAHFTVAVIGAGPAGATAANVLCLGGVRDVALIDKARFPRDKTCGDAITVGAIDVMREIDLEHRLAAHPLIEKVVIAAPSGARAIAEPSSDERPLPRACVIPRKVFDAYLATSALERGAVDLTGYRLDRAERNDERWSLELSSGDMPSRHRRRITADFLIGADGAMSKVRRTLGLALNSDKHMAVAIRGYARTTTPQKPQLQLDILDIIRRGGYGWVYSIGPQAANVGIGTYLLNYKAQSLHLRGLLALYTSHIGGGYSLNEMDAQSAPLPVASQLPPLALPEHCAALIGDAASMINPLTGEGISYGMVAGLLLGRALAHAVVRGHDLGRAAAEYEKEFRCRFASHFRGGAMLKNVIWARPLLEGTINAYRRDAVFFRDALGFMFGGERNLSVTRLLWRGLVHA